MNARPRTAACRIHDLTYEERFATRRRGGVREAAERSAAALARKIILVATLTLGSIAVSTAYGKPLSPPNEASAERTEAMCKLTAQERHRRGKAFDRAVQQCVGQISPNLGYWERCRQHARRRQLKGTALRDDVDTCMAREP